MTGRCWLPSTGYAQYWDTRRPKLGRENLYDLRFDPTERAQLGSGCRVARRNTFIRPKRPERKSSKKAFAFQLPVSSMHRFHVDFLSVALHEGFCLHQVNKRFQVLLSDCKIGGRQAIGHLHSLDAHRDPVLHEMAGPRSELEWTNRFDGCLPEMGTTGAAA